MEWKDDVYWIKSCLKVGGTRILVLLAGEEDMHQVAVDSRDVWDRMEGY